jgi:hypothetical protein
MIEAILPPTTCLSAKRVVICGRALDPSDEVRSERVRRNLYIEADNPLKVSALTVNILGYEEHFSYSI